MFQKWLMTAAKIRDYVGKMEELSCPNCKKHTIDYLYIGDEEDMIGYLLVWCNSCKKGIHISRVIIPPELKMVSFDVAEKELSRLVPKIDFVTP